MYIAWAKTAADDCVNEDYMTMKMNMPRCQCNALQVCNFAVELFFSIYASFFIGCIQQFLDNMEQMLGSTCFCSHAPVFLRVLIEKIRYLFGGLDFFF